MKELFPFALACVLQFRHLPLPSVLLLPPSSSPRDASFSAGGSSSTLALYEASQPVQHWAASAQELRDWLVDIQLSNGVQVSQVAREPGPAWPPLLLPSPSASRLTSHG